MSPLGRIRGVHGLVLPHSRRMRRARHYTETNRLTPKNCESPSKVWSFSKLCFKSLCLRRWWASILRKSTYESRMVNHQSRVIKISFDTNTGMMTWYISYWAGLREPGWAQVTNDTKKLRACMGCGFVNRPHIMVCGRWLIDSSDNLECRMG